MLFIFMGLQRMFLPNAPAPAQPAAKKPDAPADNPPPKAEVKVDPNEPNPKLVDGDKREKPPVPVNPERVVTLGSMDPVSGYKLLVTVCSRGGGLERVELVDEKKVDRFRYQALENRGGYLGYLGWRSHESGVLITTVPKGSPAAQATSKETAGPILPGDVLNHINDVEVGTYAAVQQALAEIKPGKLVKLGISRGVADAKTTLIFETTVCQPPLDVLRTEENLAEYVPGNISRASCLTTLASIGDQSIPTGMRSIKSLSGTLTDHWEVLPLEVVGGQGVEFRLPLAGYFGDQTPTRDLVLVKRYRLMPMREGGGDTVAATADAYTIDYETVVENRTQTPVDLAFRHECLVGLTLEGWWYSVKVSPYFFRGAGQRDVRFGDATGNHSIVLARSVYDRKLKTPRDPGLFVDAGGTPAARTLRYVGLDTQYFAAAFLPHSEAPNALENLQQAGSDVVAKVSQMVSSQIQASNTSFWIDTDKQSVEPGSHYSTRYRIFTGPKDTAVLEHFGLERFIEYGWIYYITKPLSWILYLFYSVVRNYGIAIILLTLLVRGGMFPLGRQAAVNAQKMQELQPEMKRINDLYKDDMQKRADAMRELYTKHNFRPLASCLPVFFQIPIFMALYRCLSVDISLRQEPLIPGLSWCSNLAGPDMLFDWSSWMPEIIAGRGTGYLGPYFNILPVITVALFLVQQKVLMPKATDEQTQMTQNMMQIMTVVMGVLFFKVPSGLCIYFITSSLWSLAERKLVKWLVPPTPNAAQNLAPAASPRTSNPLTANRSKESDARQKSPSRLSARLAELKEMLDKPAVRSGTQRRDPDKSKKRKRQ